MSDDRPAAAVLQQDALWADFGEPLPPAAAGEPALPKPARRQPKPRQPLRRSRPIPRSGKPKHHKQPKRQQRIRKPKPLSRRWLMRVADEVYSLYVRSRGRCEVCGVILPVRQLQWSHIWGRSWHAIRYHPDNSLSSCSPCHVKATRRPDGGPTGC